MLRRVRTIFLPRMAALALLALGCNRLPSSLVWSTLSEADAATVAGETSGAHMLKVLRDGAPILTFKVSELQRKVPGQQPSVYDALAGGPVEYEGVLLAALLDTLIGPDWVRADHIRLLSLGGVPTDISSSRLLARKSWLVWKRMDRPDFVVMVAGRPTPAGPLSLVWETGIESGIMPGSVDPDRWVRGITAVDVVMAPAAVAAALALPGDATPGAQAGAALFESHCARCHTLDGIGASTGLELLRPVPVTEIWRPGYLERFLDDPTALRLRATAPKLPPEVPRRAQAIGDLVAFLHAAARAPQPSPQAASPTPVR
ncbi:MAG: c-type cytochrome [Deltaproteobacteria bacterium]|nr:c-type cytochrome [Deltaproteobacteria bacterium]